MEIKVCLEHREIENDNDGYYIRFWPEHGDRFSVQQLKDRMRLNLAVLVDQHRPDIKGENLGIIKLEKKYFHLYLSSEFIKFIPRKVKRITRNKYV